MQIDNILAWLQSRLRELRGEGTGLKERDIREMC